MIQVNFKKNLGLSAKKKIAAAIGAGAIFAASFLPALALTEVGVAATVTVQNIAVSVADGTVAYGTLGADASADTTSGGLNDSQTVTNDGNVNSDFDIKGSDSTPGSWTLAATAGADQYVHEFCRGDTGTCDGTPTFTALTTSYAELDTAVAASGTQDFDLRITTPTSSGSFVQQSVNVTVLVTAS